MARVVKLAVLALAALLPALAVAHNVKHIVVLMMENRYADERDTERENGGGGREREGNERTRTALCTLLNSPCDDASNAPVRDGIALIGSLRERRAAWRGGGRGSREEERSATVAEGEGEGKEKRRGAR